MQVDIVRFDSCGVKHHSNLKINRKKLNDSKHVLLKQREMNGTSDDAPIAVTDGGS